MAQAQQVVQQRGEFFLTEEEQAMVDKITAQLLSENAKERDSGIFFDEGTIQNCPKRTRFEEFCIIIGGVIGLLLGIATGFNYSAGKSMMDDYVATLLFAIIGIAVFGVIGWIVANVSAECRHENRK